MYILEFETAYLLLLLVYFLVSVSKASAVSFGITTASDATSTAVTLTLHWDLHVTQCIIHPSTADTQYLCHTNVTTTTTCFIGNHDNLYTLHIDHDDSDTLQIQSVVVYDESTYFYGINAFCVDLNSSQYGRGLLSNNNCSMPSQFLFFEDICLDNSNCSSPHLDISFGTLHSNAFDEIYGVVTTGSDESGLTCAPTMNPVMQPTLSPTTLSDDYIFVFIGQISWIEANEYCSDRFGTSLAFIGSQDDNAEATNLIHIETASHDLPLYTFFGLNAFYEADLWRFNGNIGWYYNWDATAGEPGSDSCAVMRESGVWYTTSCTSKQNVSILCNRYSEIINDTRSGKYKYVFVGDISWVEANTFCNTHYNTTLATISSAEDNTELALFASYHYATFAIINTEMFWIGLHDLGSDTEWQWIDHTAPIYYNWSPKVEHDVGASCAIAHIYGLWDERACHDLHPYPFFCNDPNYTVTPSPTTMSFGYSAVNTTNKNYIRVYMNSTTSLSWIEANEYCRTEYGTYLASITSAEENIEITYTSLLQIMEGSTPTGCNFIGLHRMHSATDWKWIDGNKLNYTYWGSYQPHSDTDACSYMCTDDGAWRYISCSRRYSEPLAFVCNSKTVLPTPSITASPTMIDNYTAVNTSNMNYIRVWMGRITWIEANEHCRTQYGTYLASISSPEKNTEIAYLGVLEYMTGATPTACSFIGLHRMHGMMDWNWIDGSTLNYTYWGTQQPDDDTETCSYMCSDGAWASVKCTSESKFTFICNAPTETDTTASSPTKQPTFVPTGTSSSTLMLTSTLYRTMLIILVTVSCVLITMLCFVSYCCYKRNKLLEDAVVNDVEQVHPEQQQREECGCEDDDVNEHPVEDGQDNTESDHI